MLTIFSDQNPCLSFIFWKF